ncbi:hypothetical protein REPUB_Repub05bG0049600 [Reevesia pubescens]
MSGAARKAWSVAATIGAVEALKDQGICRWNYTIRSLHQHGKNSISSFTQPKMISSSSSSSSSAAAAVISYKLREEQRKKAEEKMRKVMDLNCWGPNTVRF